MASQKVVMEYTRAIAHAMQEYMDEAPIREEGVSQYLEGFDNLDRITAVQLFNDFLLYLNDGVTPPFEVRG